MRILHLSRPIEDVLERCRPLAREVELWYRCDQARDEWLRLARLACDECTMEEILDRFGGGLYRARVLGVGRACVGILQFTIGGSPSDHARWLARFQPRG